LIFSSPSRIRSRPIGVVLVAAGVTYLIDVVATFLAPDLGAHLHGPLAIVPSIAEPAMVIALLVKGLRSPRLRVAILATA